MRRYSRNGTERDGMENIGGVKCHRALPANPTPRPHAPRIRDAWCEERKLVVEDKETGDKSFFRYVDQGIVIESYGVGVKFKRSRGGKFKDSREPNKSFSRDEILAELERMMDDKYEAQRAMDALQFG